MSTAQIITLQSPISALPRPGDYWPGQGGHRITTVRGQNGQPDYELIAVPSSLKLLGKRAWGEYGQRIEGADSSHDGLANTIALAAAGNETALAIQALEIEGHRDLYWGSQAENALIRALAPELLQGIVWSSTQSSSLNAWFQSFDGGYSYIFSKDNQFAVCAVRRFIIPSAT